MAYASVKLFDTCCVCGHPIYSDESLRRGYGGECAAAITKAKYIVVFSNDDLRSKYYNLDIYFLRDLIEEELKKKLRNSFKKSFLPSVKEQIDTKHFLTKKQRDILMDMLVYSKCGMLDEYRKYVDIEKDRMFEDIKVDIELIEKARQIIREKKKEESNV